MATVYCTACNAQFSADFSQCPRCGMRLSGSGRACRPRSRSDDPAGVPSSAVTIAKVAGPFDLIFQDGAKGLYGPLLDRLVALLRPGGLLVTDNVLWDGEVVPGHMEPKTPEKSPG